MNYNKDRPENKVVDGKTLKHVLLLLKGYIDANKNYSGESISSIEIKNTDSKEVKELVYSIVYGTDQDIPEFKEENIEVDNTKPLVSYLTEYINKKIEKIQTEKNNYVTEEDILNMFRCDSFDPLLNTCDCLNNMKYASKQDILDFFSR